MTSSRLKLVLLTVYLLISFLLTMCEEKEKGEFMVTGTISYLGRPVANASAFLDGRSDIASFTDEDGSFSIAGVAMGSHTLTLTKTDAYGAVSTIGEQIIVTGDLTLNNLILPEPPVLRQVPLENLTSQNTITLHWSPYLSNDFRKYKLFTHNDSLFDETTGTPALETISAQDTTFQLTLGLKVEKYFRLYVYDASGKIAASNVLHVSTTFRDKEKYVMSPEWKLIRVAKWGYGEAINQTRITIDTVAGHVFMYWRTITSGSQNGGLYLPSDASFENWKRTNGIGSAGSLIGPSNVKGNFYVLAGSNPGGAGFISSLFKSQDGINWQKDGDRGTGWRDYRDMSFVNDTIVYAIDQNGKLLYSIDKAKNFTIKNASVALSNIRFTDPQTGYGSNNGRQLKTTDGGITWVETFANMPGATATFSYPNNAIGFAVTSDAKVYRTADAGASWTLTTIHDDKLPSPSELWFYSAIGFKDNIAYLFFTLSSTYPKPRVTYMYRSTDGGLNWTPDGRNIFLQATRMFIKDGFVYVMGTQEFNSGSNHYNIDSLGYSIILKRPL